MNIENELKGLRDCCEEVDAVMGQTPSWVLRWGITMIAVVVASLLASTWFVKWPDTLTAHGYIDVTSSTHQWVDMVILLSAEQIRSLREGMEVKVYLDVKDKDWGHYRGMITEIPLMTDSTRLYSVHIPLNKYEQTNEGHVSIYELTKKSSHISHPILEATVIITLSDRRLLLRIIEK